MNVHVKLVRMVGTPMNILDIKQTNHRRIYFHLREKGTATRQELAYELKLSLPTVTQNLERLIAQGLVCSGGKIVSRTGGRNPVSYSYVPDARVAVGVDITKHHVKCIVVDLDGKALQYVYRRRLYMRDDEYLKQLGEEVSQIIEASKVDRKKILGVGIAVPGLVDHRNGVVVDGRVIDNSGMTCEQFAKYIDLPAKLIHDSDAAGFSEIWVSPEIRNAFYISLCNSVGGSVFIDDRAYLGDGLYAGEVGHIRIQPNGLQCYCGQRGCLDPYVNAEVLSNHTDGDLKAFFERMENGDAALWEAWNRYLDNLATGITAMRMMYGCTVIIGGYVGTYIRHHMDALRRKVDELNPFGEKSEKYLLPCRNKIEAVAAGAALYFVQEFLNHSLVPEGTGERRRGVYETLHPPLQ